ncbi:chromosome partition protein MukB [Hafnia alvei]|uniref:chromosome partition protein MukB n=1 Tax=Hafnia alvei TaxID=569 RepID=UPI0010332857|nr:chromosome partition protein MukB [Hafnia alvei]TBM12768.1 chromosome partition protein MukB [Hafnia alvei]
MSHYPLIRSLSIININGIMARTLDLVNPSGQHPSRQYGGTVSLLGNNGAGKTSLLGAFMFSQIPDIRYISLGTRDDFKVSQSIKDSEMFPRLGQPCLVALEIEARGSGARNLYIVRAEKKTGTTLETQLYCLTLPDGIKPLDCLLDRDDSRNQLVTSETLRDKAAQLGCRLQSFKDPSAYMLALFQDGILPRACQTPDEKYKLAQILHSAMAGKLDKSIEKRLSEYLMAHTRGNVNSIVSMVHESMMKVRYTQRELEGYKKDYQLFEQLLEQSLQFSAFAWAVTELQLAKVDEERLAVQKVVTRLDTELIEIDENLKTLERERQKIKDCQVSIQQQINNIDPRKQCANTGKIYYSNKQEAISQLVLLEPQFETAQKQYQQQQSIVQDLKRRKRANEDSQRQTEKQLAHVGTLYDSAQKMAALYAHAQQLVNDITLWQPDFSLPQLASLAEQLTQQNKEYGDALSRSQYQLHHCDEIIATYRSVAGKALKVGDEIAENDSRHWFNEKRIALESWSVDAARLEGFQQHKQGLQRDQQKQKRMQQRLNHAGISTLPEDNTSFELLLAAQQEKEQELHGQKEGIVLRQQEIQQQINQLNIDIGRLKLENQQWHRLHPSVNYLRGVFPSRLFTLKDCREIRLDCVLQLKSIKQDIIVGESDIRGWQQRHNKLSERETGSLEYLRTLAADVSGLPVIELYADIDVQDAEYFEAALGPLMNAILINGDIDDATRTLLSIYGHQWPLPDVSLIKIVQPIEVLRNGQFDHDLLFKDITNEYDISGDNPWCVIDEQQHRRISLLRTDPILGEKARETLIVQLGLQIQHAEEHIKDLEQSSSALEQQIKHIQLVEDAPAFIWDEEPPLEETCLQRNAREKALNELNDTHQRILQQWKKEQAMLLALQQCEPDIDVLFEDITQKLSECGCQIERADIARRALNRYQVAIGQIGNEFPLLREDYPENIIQLQQQVQHDEVRFNTSKTHERQIKELDQNRAHLNPEYADAKKILENEEQAQAILTEQLKELEVATNIIKDEHSKAEALLTEQHRIFNDLSGDVKHHQKNCDDNNKKLEELEYEYTPGLEIELDNQFSELLRQAEKQRKALAKDDETLKETHILRMSTTNEWETSSKNLTLLSDAYEAAGKQRNQVLQALKVEGSYGELEPAMLIQLQQQKERNSQQPSVIEQSILASLAYLTAENHISQAEPFMQHLASCRQAGGDIIVPCVTLYGQAVAFFRRRARQDIQRATQPLEMLRELSRAAEKAQEMLAKTESMFQMKREELADALLRRINDEKRAINKLSAELSGISFGQVASVHLEVRAVKHFQDTLTALRAGGNGMDDLFSATESVTDALAGLYKKTTQHEIAGERLLDHRNYLEVKTSIRRHGSEQLEMLDGSNLSTGERIGSGLAVLIAVLKHWGRSSHGRKEPFALPLVMDEVSRLDAASQATVHELAVRTGCQMMVAAPESLGQITGIGYQLVRTVIRDGTHDNAQGPRYQVKITGVRDAQQLPFDVDSYLEKLELPEKSNQELNYV